MQVDTSVSKTLKSAPGSSPGSTAGASLTRGESLRFQTEGVMPRTFGALRVPMFETHQREKLHEKAHGHHWRRHHRRHQRLCPGPTRHSGHPDREKPLPRHGNVVCQRRSIVGLERRGLDTPVHHPQGPQMDAQKRCAAAHEPRPHLAQAQLDGRVCGGYSPVQTQHHRHRPAGHRIARASLCLGQGRGHRL